tara:strand:- start:594 stop:1145 length:552 start_codon:yes stop_codon:yes gene_type:complete
MLLCPVCQETILEAVADCTGQFEHCGGVYRFSTTTSEFVVWEHSEDSYNPSHIVLNPRLTVVQKERSLNRLFVSLTNMDREYHFTVRRNLQKAKDALAGIRKQMLNAQVADQNVSKSFDVKMNWGDKKALNKVWMLTLRMWAKSKTDLTPTEIDEKLGTVVDCVRFARAHEIDVPHHLRLITP